jgi:hypothetical protein
MSPVELLTVVVLPSEFVAVHEKFESKLVIGRVKPSAVAVGAPKAGVFALPVSEVYELEVAVPVS